LNRRVVGVGAASCVFDAGGTNISWSFNQTAVSGLTFQNMVNTGANEIFSIGGASVINSMNGCIIKNGSVSGSSGSQGAVWNLRASLSAGTFSIVGCLIYNIVSTAVIGNVGYLTSQFSYDNGTVQVNVFNNTFYTNAVGSAILNAQYTNHSIGRLTYKNNIYFTQNATPWNASSDNMPYVNSSTNCVFGYTSVPAGVKVTVTSDPLFVDPLNGNFNLRPTSPCIDAGTVF